MVDWLPIWGREAREKGFDLPLPFGVGLTYTYMKQNMVVSHVTIEGKPLGVTLRDAETITDTAVFRADAWLFPFLNVYGLVGQTSGVTRPALALPNGEVLKSKVSYDRSSYGAGATLAAGYKAWFATVDTNWTTGPIFTTDGGQISDEPIQSVTATPRTGLLFNTDQGGVGALWIGAMYIQATSEIHDVIDLRQHPVLAELVGSDSLKHLCSRVASGPVELPGRRKLATRQALVSHRRGWRPHGSGPVHRFGDVALLKRGQPLWQVLPRNLTTTPDSIPG